MRSKRYVCIHAHFYQPPRENPWSGEVEREESAGPYHDWNERITAECYSPNANSRILDKKGDLVTTVNNYAMTSFNFGPTLLRWLEREQPAVYASVLRADSESIAALGHGNAIAQVYNHMIMPLANNRDKRTQVAWGVEDFEYSFRRRPEGMWLPEMAVDVETLEVLTEFGIKFTILSPHQALGHRDLGSNEWTDARKVGVDTRVPYLCQLPSGRSIALFFRDAEIAREIAFGQMLNDAENFTRSLAARFSDDGGAQLVHVATDGETYGHHHVKGEMALSYALRYLDINGLARITNYGRFLEDFPPTREVEVAERTSWSCPHGVERWRSDCGCRASSHEGWNQAWRTPFRSSMDWLGDALASVYEAEALELGLDPWKERDAYIASMLKAEGRGKERASDGPPERTGPPATPSRIRDLLEMERFAMLMYASCAWFWDDMSGLETVYAMRYAARAIGISADTAGVDLERGFVERLRESRSNRKEFGDGARLYELLVKPRVEGSRGASAPS